MKSINSEASFKSVIEEALLQFGYGRGDNANFQATKPLAVNISQIDRPTAYEVTLSFNGVTAYSGTFTAKAVPF